MSQTAVSTIKNVPLGSTITFQSKNPNDLTVWTGTLESLNTYKSILAYGNPASYNTAVRQADSTVSSDVTTLTYFLITVDNDATVPTTQEFANEWIASGTLFIVTPGNTVTLVVSDPLNNSNAIVSLLASAGYAATISSTSS